MSPRHAPADDVLVQCQVLQESLQPEPPPVQKPLLVVISDKTFRRQCHAKAREQPFELQPSMEEKG